MIFRSLTFSLAALFCRLQKHLNVMSGCQFHYHSEQWARPDVEDINHQLLMQEIDQPFQRFSSVDSRFYIEVTQTLKFHALKC